MKALLLAALLAPALPIFSAGADEPTSPRPVSDEIRGVIMAHGDLHTKIADSVSVWLNRAADMPMPPRASAAGPRYTIANAADAPCYSERVEMDDKLVGSCVLKVHAPQMFATVVVTLDDTGELTAQPLQVTVE